MVEASVSSKKYLPCIHFERFFHHESLYMGIFNEDSKKSNLAHLGGCLLCLQPTRVQSPASHYSSQHSQKWFPSTESEVQSLNIPHVAPNKVKKKKLLPTCILFFYFILLEKDDFLAVLKVLIGYFWQFSDN